MKAFKTEHFRDNKAVLLFSHFEGLLLQLINIPATFQKKSSLFSYGNLIAKKKISIAT